jgi:hypothetical protein
MTHIFLETIIAKGEKNKKSVDNFNSLLEVNDHWAINRVNFKKSSNSKNISTLLKILKASETPK